MNIKSFWLKIVVFVLIAVSLGGCAGLTGDQAQAASGSVAVTKVAISSELGGKVREVLYKEGDPVKAGAVLFRLDDEFLRVQKSQAEASANRVKSSLELAKAQQESAQIQSDLALSQTRALSRDARRAAWEVEQPQVIALPSWYFQTNEEIRAADAELQDARQALNNEQANLDQVLKKSSGSKFAELENKLAQAQAAYRTADDTNELAGKAKKNDELKKVAQDALDKAKADLESFKKEYDRALTSAAAKEILEARARQAVAQTRFDQAVERYDRLLIGEDSLQVKAAAAALAQAKAGVTTAEAALVEAQAGLKAIELQLSKAEVKAPVDGIILSRTLEAGEIVGPGGTVMVVGRLEEASVTVYVPETQYGQITLGQTAEVSVDSFQGKVFLGKVTHIADQAEFTPRNVQTVDGRRTTVYAVKISIPNPNQELKPGMPADVRFKK
jgi:multidrug resistance efflux pump